MSTSRARIRTLIATSIVAAGLVLGTGAVGAQTPPPAPTAAPLTATTATPTVVDPCTLLKPADVTKAMRKAPKALRPIHVSEGVGVQPAATDAAATGAPTVDSCTLSLLLRKNAGGSVQVLVTPTRKGTCPPKPATKKDKVKVAGKQVVLVRSGTKRRLSGVVVAKKGSCVSVAVVLSNGKPTPTAAYVALMRRALARI